MSLEIMRSLQLTCTALSLGLIIGCARTHPEPVAYYSGPTPPLTPTSDRPDVRVYSPTTVPEEPPPAPPRVADPDIDLGLSVSQLLKEDPYLDSISGNVEARIIHGVVILRGSVPSYDDRDRIYARVLRVPGVVRVENDLDIDLRL